MAIHIRRREFIFTLGGAAAAWPLAARAQQPTVPVIGFLGPGSAQSDASRVTGFRQGLSEAGLVEGRNFTIEYRWADSHYDRLPALATELVHRQVAVIATSSTPAVLAAKAATTTIPIVFEMATNPVKLGLVASFNRPGGNITGVTQGSAEIVPKRLELLHELLPKAGSLALLVNPTAPELAEPQTREVRSAAQTLGIHLHVLNASTEQDFDRVFARLTELRAGGLVIGGDAFFTRNVKQLAALTVQHAVPAIYQYREFAAAGGLMGYGSNITDTHRLVGIYAGRILKGDKPADLPVQQATTKVEMYINLKTARALGITITVAAVWPCRRDFRVMLFVAMHKSPDVATLQLTADDHLPGSINAVHLKDRLGDVETDCRDRLHSWLLRIVGALTAPTYGTYVPVEEPSTASEAVVSRRSKADHLFDHLVGAREQRWRHLQAERLGGFEVDDQLEPGRKFDREIGRLGTFQNFVHEVGCAAKVCGNVNSITDQPASLSLLPEAMGRRHSRCAGQLRDAPTLRQKEAISRDDHGLGARLAQLLEGRRDFRLAARAGGDHLDPGG